LSGGSSGRNEPQEQSKGSRPESEAPKDPWGMKPSAHPAKIHLSIDQVFVACRLAWE